MNKKTISLLLLLFICPIFSVKCSLKSKKITTQNIENYIEKQVDNLSNQDYRLIISILNSREKLIEYYFAERLASKFGSDTEKFDIAVKEELDILEKQTPSLSRDAFTFLEEIENYLDKKNYGFNFRNLKKIYSIQKSFLAFMQDISEHSKSLLNKLSHKDCPFPTNKTKPIFHNTITKLSNLSLFHEKFQQGSFTWTHLNPSLININNYQVNLFRNLKTNLKKLSVSNKNKKNNNKLKNLTLDINQFIKKVEKGIQFYKNNNKLDNIKSNISKIYEESTKLKSIYRLIYKKNYEKVQTNQKLNIIFSLTNFKRIYESYKKINKRCKKKLTPPSNEEMFLHIYGNLPSFSHFYPKTIFALHNEFESKEKIKTIRDFFQRMIRLHVLVKETDKKENKSPYKMYKDCTTQFAKKGAKCEKYSKFDLKFIEKLQSIMAKDQKKLIINSEKTDFSEVFNLGLWKKLSDAGLLIKDKNNETIKIDTPNNELAPVMCYYYELFDKKLKNLEKKEEKNKKNFSEKIKTKEKEIKPEIQIFSKKNNKINKKKKSKTKNYKKQDSKTKINPTPNKQIKTKEIKITIKPIIKKTNKISLNNKQIVSTKKKDLKNSTPVIKNKKTKKKRIFKNITKEIFDDIYIENIENKEKDHVVIKQSWGGYPEDGMTSILYLNKKNVNINIKKINLNLKVEKDNKFHRAPDCLYKYINQANLIQIETEKGKCKINELNKILKQPIVYKKNKKLNFIISIEAKIAPKNDAYYYKNRKNVLEAKNINKSIYYHSGFWILLFDRNGKCYHKCFHEYKESYNFWNQL